MFITATELLEMAVAAYGFLSRPTLAKALGYGAHREADAARRRQLWDLQREGCLQRAKRAGEIGWCVTLAGRRRLAELRNSPRLRSRPWDGRWRLVMFDFPEISRKQRDAFRWWLRVERLGQLQKSVWVTPFPLSAELERFLKEAAERDWILLFESPEKGPVSDPEIAQRAWPLDDLVADYGKYLAEFGDRLTVVERCRATALELARWRAEETVAYEDLLQHDPFLPKRLLPAGFPGTAADQLHDRFVKAVARALATPNP